MAKMYGNLLQLITDLAKEASEKESYEIFYYEDIPKLSLGWSWCSVTNGDYDDIFMIKVSDIKKLTNQHSNISESIKKLYNLIKYPDGRKEITKFISLLSQCSEIDINNIERIIKMKAFW